MARPVLDTAHVTTSTGTATARTFSHTVPSGTSLLVVLLQGWIVGESSPPSAITWNGTALTRITLSSGSFWHEQHGIWYLANPSAATANIVISGGDPTIEDGGIMTAVNLSSVDTSVGTSGIRATALSGADQRTTITLSPTTGSNDLIVSYFSQQLDTSTTGQTYGGTSGAQSVLASVGYNIDAIFLTTSAPTASGQNVTFLGSAASSYPSGLAISIAGASSGTSYNYSATGGVTTGGAATLKRTQTASGAGGVATGGAATLKRSFARLASGGLSTGGAAVLKQVRAYLASGGLTTGGAASVTLTAGAFSYVASGGITTGGAASLRILLHYLASGGVTIGGAATLKRTQTASGAGGVATGGAATLKRSFARLASGGLSTGGAAVLKQVRAYLASGGLTTGGAASVTLTAGAFSYVASGGITTGGAASLRILLHYLASGGVTIGGAASAYLWSSLTALPHGDPAFARLSSVAAMERITPLARVA